MTALYTFDVYSSLDGYGSYGPEGDWGGYWGKQEPEFLDRRLALYHEPQRLVLGANTMRMFMQSIGPRTGFLKDVDAVNGAMRNLATTVVSTTLEGPLDWPDATLVRGDAVDRGRPAQGGVRRASAVARQPVDEPGADGRRLGRPRPGHHLSRGHWPDRYAPDLRRCSRLRPRVDREQDTRRPHAGAHLPADASRLLVHRDARATSHACSPWWTRSRLRAHSELKPAERRLLGLVGPSPTPATGPGEAPQDRTTRGTVRVNRRAKAAS